MTIEENLKRLIELKSGSVRAFSIEADVPYTTTRSILERGVMKSNVENIFKIAKHLGMTPEQIAELNKNATYINEIIETSIKLEESRQAKVNDFAKTELKKQEDNDDLLIAAHMEDDLSEDEQQQVNDFIEKLKREQNK